VSAPPIVMGDQVTGVCPTHVMPNPASGIPQPAGPLPFSAPLTVGVAVTVMIGGLPAALVGSLGYNTPPHIGLAPVDPFFVPTLQIGTVVSGSLTVFVEGRPLATAIGTATMCATPGTFVPSVVTVMVE